MKCYFKGEWNLKYKKLQKVTFVWDCFVLSWRWLPELAASWGCLALRKDGDRKCCLFLLLFPHNLKNPSLTLTVLLWSWPDGQSLQWQLLCKKMFLFVRSFRLDRFKYIIDCIQSYQVFICWASFEMWSSSTTWIAILHELCFAPSN